MNKKHFLTACMAIAAFAAFVAAPPASASPVLTSGGVRVPTGASITLKNTGILKFTSAFTIECSSVHLTGTVTENSGTAIKATFPATAVKFTGTATGGDCTANSPGPFATTFNSELCLATVKGTDNMTITGCSGNISYTKAFTGAGSCKYETVSVSGTYLTNTAATINISEQEAKLKEGSFFCGSSEKLDLDLDFYTTEGTQLTIS
jgi:hypothetical protein